MTIGDGFKSGLGQGIKIIVRAAVVFFGLYVIVKFLPPGNIPEVKIQDATLTELSSNLSIGFGFVYLFVRLIMDD